MLENDAILEDTNHAPELKVVCYLSIYDVGEYPPKPKSMDRDMGMTRTRIHDMEIP